MQQESQISLFPHQEAEPSFAGHQEGGFPARSARLSGAAAGLSRAAQGAGSAASVRRWSTGASSGTQRETRAPRPAPRAGSRAGGATARARTTSEPFTQRCVVDAEGESGGCRCVEKQEF